MNREEFLKKGTIMNTEKQVKEIISEKLGIEESKIVPKSELINDLGADSLDQVELIMAFEDEFDLEIPEEDAEKLKTVNDIFKYIESKI